MKSISASLPTPPKFQDSATFGSVPGTSTRPHRKHRKTRSADRYGYAIAFVLGAVTATIVLIASTLVIAGPELRTAKTEPVALADSAGSLTSEAQGFLASRLNPIANPKDPQTPLWQVAELQLGDTWHWCTSNEMTRPGAPQRCYTVDPGAVDPRADIERVDQGAVSLYRLKFQCRSSDCVARNESGDMTALRPIEAFAWYYADEDTAERAARAAEQLMRQAGAVPALF